jgi:hypothetical protein
VRCVLQSAGVAIAGSFPLAALIALVFRFPVPFVGYQSGPRAMLPALIGVFFYGILGGVGVQAVLGGVGGVAAYLLGRRRSMKTNRLTIALGLIAALPGLLLLAILDWIIGPW